MNKLMVTAAPHTNKWNSTSIMMFATMVALLPTLVSGVINFGVRAVYILLISVASCYVFDVLMVFFRQKRWFFQDFSGIVTGLMLTCILPVNAPLYYPVIGAFIAIVIFKGMFGGIGKNIFNPAAAARVVLGLIFSGLTLDLFTGGAMGNAQSPLAYFILGDYSAVTIRALFLGSASSAIGTASIMCITITGIMLMIFSITDFVVPLGAILTFTITVWASKGTIAILPYLFSGSFLFATFFMITDPTTSPNTVWGRLFYGLIFGAIAGLFRVYFVLGETGVFVAVVLVNMLSGLLDKIFNPIPLGVRRAA